MKTVVSDPSQMEGSRARDPHMFFRPGQSASACDQVVTTVALWDNHTAA